MIELIGNSVFSLLVGCLWWYGSKNWAEGLAISIIYYGITLTASKTKQINEEVNEINSRAYKSFKARHGEPPEDPDALESYYAAQEKEGL